MNPDFKNAANPSDNSKNQLVFVSDFQGTIEGNGVNFPLLQLLNDAKASGHRVIIASTSALHAVISFLELLPSAGKRRHINLDNIQTIINDGDVRAKYELCTLTDAQGKPLKFDFVFDDNLVSYVEPENEIRVTPPFVNGGAFKTSPLTLDQIRLSFIDDYLQQVLPNLHCDRHP